jgi:hypothetical protein
VRRKAADRGYAGATPPKSSDVHVLCTRSTFRQTLEPSCPRRGVAGILLHGGACPKLCLTAVGLPPINSFVQQESFTQRPALGKHSVELGNVPRRGMWGKMNCFPEMGGSDDTLGGPRNHLKFARTAIKA